MGKQIRRTEITEGTVKIVWEFDYPDFLVGSPPEICYSCPVGFMDHECGRRVPLDEKWRPPECKLRTLEDCLRDQLTTNCNGFNRTESDHVKPGWISVEDRLPKPLQDVLVARKDSETHVEYMLSGKRWSENDTYSLPVTHWMPLPLKPEVEA